MVYPEIKKVFKYENSPYFVPEISELGFVCRIKDELGLRFDDDACLEPSTAKYHTSGNMRVLLKNIFYPDYEWMLSKSQR